MESLPLSCSEISNQRVRRNTQSKEIEIAGKQET
jgi:hypothetical protein